MTGPEGIVDFLGISNEELLFVRGAAVGMSLDHNNDVFYVLRVIGSDYQSNEHYVTLAIPPEFTEQFVAVVNGMVTKRE